MSDIWATLIGGAIALAGSIGSTSFAQWRAPKTEQRNRAQRAADQMISDLSELRSMPKRPDWDDKEQRRQWDQQHRDALNRIRTQALTLTSAELRARIAFVVQVLNSPDVMEDFGRVREGWARSELCRDASECIGSFIRGERKLPPPVAMVETARRAIAASDEYMEMQIAAQEAEEKRMKEERRKKREAEQNPDRA